MQLGLSVTTFITENVILLCTINVIVKVTFMPTNIIQKMELFEIYSNETFYFIQFTVTIRGINQDTTTYLIF